MPALGPGTGASSWTPLAISNVLAGWWSAKDASTLIPGTAPGVARWVDKSGKNNDWVQGTAAQQPNTGTRSFLGQNVLDFTGTRDMACATLTDSPTNRFVAAVAAIDVAANNHPLLAGNGNDGYEFRIYSNVGTGAEVLESGVAHHFLTGASATVANTPYIWTNQWAPGAQTQTRNGAADGTGTSSATFSHGGTAVLGLEPGTARLDGWLGELIVVDAVVTPQLVRQVTQYLSGEWRIPLLVGGACSPPLVFL